MVCIVVGWLLTFAVLAALAALVSRVLLGYESRSGELLAAREIALIDAVALALFPPGGELEPSGADAEVGSYLDRVVAAQDLRNRRLMRALFTLMEHATLVFPAPGGLSGFRRFSSLDLEQQQAVLERWGRSRLFFRRLAFTSLRSLITLGYFAHPPVLRALDLAPLAIDSPVCRADLLYPPIGGSRDAITLREADLTPPGDAEPLDPHGPLMSGYEEPGS